MIFNSENRYGALSVFLHWGMALAVFGMFGLGLWMVELDYYDPWYRRAPDVHRGAGILLVMALALRLVLRLVQTRPVPLASHARWETVAALAAHWLMYLLLFAVAAAGYLISTADGRGVVVFEWFEVPATFTAFDNQEEVAGDVHLILAIVTMTVVALHAAAALKHHFIDRDATLRRMFGKT